MILKEGIISPFRDEKNRLRDFSPGYPSLLCVLRLLLQSQGLVTMSYASDSSALAFVLANMNLILFDLSAAFARVDRSRLLDFHGTAPSFFASYLYLFGPVLALSHLNISIPSTQALSFFPAMLSGRSHRVYRSCRPSATC